MHFAVTRLRVDKDELEPPITAGDLEIIRNDRGGVPSSLSWALTIVTANEPWHHGLGECELQIDVDAERRFRGRAILLRSDRGRWHYFKGAGKLEGFHPSEIDPRAD